MKKILFFLIIIISLFSCNSKTNNQLTIEKDNTADKQIVLDLKKIAGKNKTEVDKVLGKSEKVETFSASNTPCKNTPCEKVYYQKDKYEIVFINGKADWITINDLSQYDLKEENIEILGLSLTETDLKNPQNVITWKNIENINEISIFNDGSGKISYAYIKVATE